VQRHLSTVRREPLAAAPQTSPLIIAPLHEARPVDLLSLRLVLREHLEELRHRGVPETVLRPIEDELRRYENTIAELVRATHA
jgi:hypothetical protein